MKSGKTSKFYFSYARVLKNKISGNRKPAKNEVHKVLLTFSKSCSLQFSSAAHDHCVIGFFSENVKFSRLTKVTDQT